MRLQRDAPHKSRTGVGGKHRCELGISTPAFSNMAYTDSQTRWTKEYKWMLDDASMRKRKIRHAYRLSTKDNNVE